jgi:hypothetical protein
MNRVTSKEVADEQHSSNLLCERGKGPQMSKSQDIYLRAHTVRAGEADPHTPTTPDIKWADYALVVDCESRITADQTLTFGFWRFCELRGNEYVCAEEGIFHDDHGLSTREFDVLRKYAKATKPETPADGCNRLRLYSRAKFVEEVLGTAIQAKALIVGFNLPFDLSRLALDWETADNGGHSLILSQWHNAKTGKLGPNKYFPRIVVKALNSKTAIIHSTRAPMSEPGKDSKRVKLWPSARFLDLRTLLWALRNKSYSLQSACKQFTFPESLTTSPADGWMSKRLSIAGRMCEPPWACKTP